MEPMASGAANTGLQASLIEATERFLHPEEIQAILRNYPGNIELQRTTVSSPPSGSVFLFDTKLLPEFKNDGYEWVKKTRGDISESYKVLRVDGQEVIVARRARAQHDLAFERRLYSLTDESEKHIFMAHYLRTAPGVKTSKASRVKSEPKKRRFECVNQDSLKRQKADLVIHRKIEPSFCPCFASGNYCSEECKCYQCLNSKEEEEEVEDARDEALRLSGSAFPTQSEYRPAWFTCDCVGDNCLKRFCGCCKAQMKGSSSRTCLN